MQLFYVFILLGISVNNLQKDIKYKKDTIKHTYKLLIVKDKLDKEIIQLSKVRNLKVIQR